MRDGGCGWALLEELAIKIEEGVQHALLPLRAGIATVDLPKGFSHNPSPVSGARAVVYCKNC